MTIERPHRRLATLATTAMLGAIRARRAWRVNVNSGLAPDSNINAATSKEQVELFGLPFRLDPNARAKSGVGGTWPASHRRCA